MNDRKTWKKMTAFLVAVLVLASLTSLAYAATDSITVLSGGNASSTPTQTQYSSENQTCTQNSAQANNSSGACNNSDCIPGGIAANTAWCNKTDLTPKNQMEQVRAGEPMLFRYRNMTMLMNCTQNCSLVVSADSTVTPKILGLSIDSPQNMTVAMNLYGSPLQGQMVAERNLNFYWGIEPNSQQQLQGQIRLHINQTELQQELNREVNTSRLTWMFWNTTSAQWQAVPSFIDENGYLVCNTNHFSTWTVAEIEQTTQSADGLLDTMTLAYIGIGLIAVITVIAAVLFLKKKN